MFDFTRYLNFTGHKKRMEFSKGPRRTHKVEMSFRAGVCLLLSGLWLWSPAPLREKRKNQLTVKILKLNDARSWKPHVYLLCHQKNINSKYQRQWWLYCEICLLAFWRLEAKLESIKFRAFSDKRLFMACGIPFAWFLALTFISGLRVRRNKLAWQREGKEERDNYKEIIQMMP